MKISGKELSGYTDAELFDAMMSDKCPFMICEELDYKECSFSKEPADCLSCWQENMK